MGASETIVAAMIGALATVTTALFQLFGAFRAKGKVDVAPRRGSTLRTTLAALALMVASAAGGFLYSELLKERYSEDLRAMRGELRELKALTTAAARMSEAARRQEIAGAADRMPVEPAVVPVRLDSEPASVESVVYVPACRMHSAGEQCQESDAQRIALCGTIPSYAQVRSIDLFVQPHAVQDPWELHRAVLEADLGGARFTGNSFEYAQSGDQKAVCVNFVHWSSDHPHIARIVVDYGFGRAAPDVAPDPSFEALEPETIAMPAPIAEAVDDSL